MRVSLARDANVPLFEDEEPYQEFMTRLEYLRSAFTSERDFLHRENHYRFRPLVNAPDGFAAGFFSRPSPVTLNHEDLTPYMAENFEASLFIIELDSDQIVWMQDNPKVGSPKGILESFFHTLLKKSDLKDWRAFVSYFESKTDYWSAVERHRHEITEILFRYVPPNAFEGKKLAQKYKTEVQTQANSDILEEKFKSEPGKMDPTSEMMAANAEIAEQGAGERELRGRKRKLLYSSSQGRMTDNVSDDDMPDARNPTFLRRVIEKLFS